MERPLSREAFAWQYLGSVCGTFPADNGSRKMSVSSFRCGTTAISLTLTGGNTLTLTAAPGGAADGVVGNGTDVVFQASSGIAQATGVSTLTPGSLNIAAGYAASGQVSPSDGAFGLGLGVGVPGAIRLSKQ